MWEIIQLSHHDKLSDRLVTQLQHNFNTTHTLFQHLFQHSFHTSFNNLWNNSSTHFHHILSQFFHNKLFKTWWQIFHSQFMMQYFITTSSTNISTNISSQTTSSQHLQQTFQQTIIQFFIKTCRWVSYNLFKHHILQHIFTQQMVTDIIHHSPTNLYHNIFHFFITVHDTVLYHIMQTS